MSKVCLTNARNAMCLKISLYFFLSLAWQITQMHQCTIFIGKHFTPLCFLSLSGSSDEVFSLALYHFNHTLVTSDLPSPALQVRGMIVFSKNLFYIMIILFLNIYIYLFLTLSLLFSEYTASAAGCCTLFRGSLAAVYSSSVIISALQTSPHMAAQSQRARRTRCA